MNKINFDDTITKADEILEYYYKNPDEENAPSPPHESHYSFFDDKNNLNVKNIAAFIIPEFEIEETVKSITYVVDGSYDGEEFLHNSKKPKMSTAKKHRIRKIHVKYDFIGFIPVKSLMQYAEESEKRPNEEISA